MSRKTRREQKIDRDKQWIGEDVINYISSSERLNATLTDDEISEIVSFTIFDKEISSLYVQNHKDYGLIFNYIMSYETMTWFSKMFDDYKNKVEGRRTCQLTEFIKKSYANVFRSLSTLSSIDEITIIKSLTIFNAAAMKREFKSLLAYVRFIKVTIYEKDGLYHIVNKDKQSQAKRWVNMQQHFLMKWDINIKMPTPESIHEWATECSEEITSS